MKVAVLVGMLSLSLGQNGSSPSAGRTPPAEVSRQDAGTLVNAYATALLARDAVTVESILSRSSLERIREAGVRRGLPDPLATFIERERRNLVEALGGAESLRTGFEVSAVEPSADGQVMAASLGLNGRSLTKGLRMTQEDGALKVVAGRSPGDSPQMSSNSNYKVANYTSLPRDFECANSRYYSVPAYGLTGGWDCYDNPIGCIPYTDLGPGITKASCVDYSCGFLFDGTHFVYQGTSYFCDYNTWGEDFLILSADAAGCHDAC
ncbi:hypothetical protein [Hyalangium versicolor]|uniref:hypothetical protein n=1 Tax=Hyalangium versicolor TaxID=2861190 RepID=UPI001CC9168D|nr:hypothetical protein [Hyalangium versicolor]